MALDTGRIEMTRFFDERAMGYNRHMRRSIPGIDRFYRRVAGEIAPGVGPASILDLGCGTGLELSHIFRRVPNAHITGIDLSGHMLLLLRRRYRRHLNRIQLVQGSYEAVPLPEASFDYAVSVMSLHHFKPDRKSAIYGRIRRALKPGGLYVEGDYVVSPPEARDMMAAFDRIMEGTGGDALYHIDIPFSVADQIATLQNAGFAEVDVAWKDGIRAVFTARAPHA